MPSEIISVSLCLSVSLPSFFLPSLPPCLSLFFFPPSFLSYSEVASLLVEAIKSSGLRSAKLTSGQEHSFVILHVMIQQLARFSNMGDLTTPEPITIARNVALSSVRPESGVHLQSQGEPTKNPRLRLGSKRNRDALHVIVYSILTSALEQRQCIVSMDREIPLRRQHGSMTGMQCREPDGLGSVPSSIIDAGQLCLGFLVCTVGNSFL